MKSFKELDIVNFESIQNQLVPYILTKYPGLTQFWNHVDQVELFSAVPELKTAIIDSLGQTPVKTYLLVIPNAPAALLANKLGAKSIHQDTSEETARLNWPILNSTSIETRFFTSDAEPEKLLLPTGETYLTYRESDCKVIDQFCMSKPAVLHVHTIHGLYPAAGPLPRYILSFKFDHSIEHVLN